MLDISMQRVLNNYLTAKKQKFAGHLIANLIRNEIPVQVELLLKSDAPLKIYGSPGKGVWADCPWVAILDTRITHTTQEGIYLVYLFSEDMSCLYLSLNQGITSVLDYYETKKEATDFLESRALEVISNISTMIEAKKFLLSIDLQSCKSSLGYYYERGNILSIKYETKHLPSDQQLVEDLCQMMNIYGHINYEKLSLQSELLDQSGLSSKAVENYQQTVNHLQYDRRNSKKVKTLKGHKCECCGIDMKRIYGFDCTEAHHLIPVSELKGQIVELDLKNDYAVLCPNCHRVVHKQPNPEDVESLKKRVEQSRYSYFNIEI